MQPKVKEAPIPNFRLYGTAETAGANLFFIIAPIPAVGEQANYKHAPHRHAQLHPLVWLSAGYTEISIDETLHPLGAGTLYLIPAGVVHGSSFSRQLDGFVLHFSPDFLLSGAGAAAGLPSWPRCSRLPTTCAEAASPTRDTGWRKKTRTICSRSC